VAENQLMSGKRIVIFSWSDSVHVMRWVTGLTERGYDIKVVSLDREIPPGMNAAILPRRGRFSYFTQASKAAAEARRFGPDLVHVHYAAGFGVWGRRAGIKPLVVSVWGSDLFQFPSNFANRIIIRRNLNAATHITATSRMLSDLVLKLAPGTQDRISLIPFGVSIPTEITPMPPVNPLKICFIKSHRPIYGIDVLIRAVATVRESFPDVQLNLAGDGPITAELQTLVTNMNLTDTVRFVGRVDHQQIQSFVAEHHLMAMPSHMESFGVAALDAAAVARPVVATNVGGIPEVVDDGRTGILVPPGDPKRLAEAIIKLGSDVDLINNMGQAGLRMVKDRFAWNKSLDMMAELYERLIYERKKS